MQSDQVQPGVDLGDSAWGTGGSRRVRPGLWGRMRDANRKRTQTDKGGQELWTSLPDCSLRLLQNPGTV